MFKLDQDFLEEFGLGDLPAREMNLLLETIYDQLELQVGMTLASNMSDEMLDEFEGFIDDEDEAGALEWLEVNCPHYKETVSEALDDLRLEIADGRTELRSMLAGDPPAELVSFLERALGDSGPMLAHDVYVRVGGLDALLVAKPEALRAVPGMSSQRIRRTRTAVGAYRESQRRASRVPANVRHSLLAGFGDWDTVLRASDTELLRIRGVGPSLLAVIRSSSEPVSASLSSEAGVLAGQPS